MDIEAVQLLSTNTLTVGVGITIEDAYAYPDATVGGHEGAVLWIKRICEDWVSINEI